MQMLLSKVEMLLLRLNLVYNKQKAAPCVGAQRAAGLPHKGAHMKEIALLL